LSPAQPNQNELDCLLSRSSGQSLPEAGKNYMAEEPQNRIWKTGKSIHSNDLSSCVELELKLPVEYTKRKGHSAGPGFSVQ
jgi:hypothetical protein